MTISAANQRMIIVDLIACDLKVFDLKGNFLKRVGKLGSGPGEYRRIMGIAEDCKYFYVHDDVLRRVSVLGKEDMNFVRSFSLPENMDGNPGQLSSFDGRLYVSVWDVKFKPLDETRKVQPIAIIDTAGNFVGRLGQYDEIYEKLRLGENAVYFDQDSAGNIYLAQYLHYGIAKYSPDGELIRRFGVKGKFRLVSSGVRGNESRDELKRLALQYSFVRQIKVSSAGYVLLQYTDGAEKFFKSRDLADQKHTLQIYTIEGQYIPSELELLGGGLLDVDADGYLYLYLSTEPDKRVIGKYRLNITKKTS